MIIPFLKNPYNIIFDKFYDITQGCVILGGSCSLKYQNIINREVVDVDINLLKKDWEKYESKLNKHFKFYPNKLLINNKYGFNSINYIGITKDGNDTFDFFIHNIDDIFIIKNNIKLLSAEFILKDKEWILETEPNLTKHIEDIQCIKKWINER
jgi:hypothetical protein